MNEENIYQHMPKHYLLCYNDACSQADTCLRRLAAQHGRPADLIVQAVNPQLNSGPSCRYYKPQNVVRMAYGMLHTYDSVLATDIVPLRRAITDSFGNGSYYLRRNGKRVITPDEQQRINQLFRDYGYPDGAVFDRYADEIEW